MTGEKNDKSRERSEDNIINEIFEKIDKNEERDCDFAGISNLAPHKGAGSKEKPYF